MKLFNDQKIYLKEGLMNEPEEIFNFPLRGWAFFKLSIYISFKNKGYKDFIQVLKIFSGEFKDFKGLTICLGDISTS